MNSSHIHTGPWIYYSRGTVFGATIALTIRYSGFLLAAITVLVGFAGAAVWGIAKYTLHQIQSSRDAKDVIHHQQQAILKNSGTAGNSAWKLLLLTL
jgi:uncharacterized membrane protein YccF (DUF307 family)